MFSISSYYREVPLYESGTYIHGNTDQEKEFERLKRQGRLLATHICPLITNKSIQLNSTKPILEIGCGVGAQTRTIRDLFPENEIICVDREERYLEQFRKEFRFEMGGITTQLGKGPCKKYVTPKIAIFDPPLPPCHTLSSFDSTSLPHVTKL